MNENIYREFLLYSLDKRKYYILLNEASHLSNEEWYKFINLLSIHGIVCFFYYNTKLNNLDNMIPSDILEILRKNYTLAAIRNLKIYNNLSKILNLLNSNNIQSIIFKGAALAEVIYKDIALRSMSDIDILVKNENIHKVDNILSNLGYKSDINNFVSKHHLRVANNIHYFNNEICIDLHPIIYNLPGIDPWENASEVRIFNADALILGAEESLLHLCIHLNSHFSRTQASRLIWWCDVATIINHYKHSLNWDRIIYLSNLHNISNTIYKILSAVNEWFEVEIPNNIFKQLNNHGKKISFNDVLDLAENKKFANERQQTDDPQIRFLLLSVSEMPSIYHKIILISRIIFPCKNFILNRYSLGQKKFYHHYYLVYLSELIKSILKGLTRYLKNKHIPLIELSKNNNKNL